MIKSIYTPLSGSLAQQRVIDVIANNLANVNTIGFKGDNVSFKLLEAEPERTYQTPVPPANYNVGMKDLKYLKGDEIKYTSIAEISPNLAQGSAIETKGKLDLMIEENGFFEIMSHDGLRLTRAGSFKVNPNGILTTKDGYPVMGEKGDININSIDFEVNDLGEIWQNGSFIDRIKIINVKEVNQLERIGNNMFIHNGEQSNLAKVELPKIRQGYLEGSNVNAIKNLTSMIIAHRSFEAYQKAIKNYDQIMEKSSSVIGEIRA